jgi:hypothetical protein
MQIWPLLLSVACLILAAQATSVDSSFLNVKYESSHLRDHHAPQLTLQTDTIQVVVSSDEGEVLRVVDRIHQRDLFRSSDSTRYGLITAWFAASGPAAILPSSLLPQESNASSNTTVSLLASWPQNDFSALIRVGL